MAIDMQNLYSGLLDTLVGGSIDDIARLIYNTLSLPVTILNAAYKILASYPKSRIGDKYWDAAYEEGRTPTDIVMDCYSNKYMEYAYSRMDASVIDWGDITFPRALSVIRLNDTTLGFISIYMINDENDQKDIVQVVEIASRVLKVYLANDKKIAKIHNSMSNVLIGRLFDGKLTTKDEIKKWESLVGFKLNGKYIALALYNDAKKQGVIDYVGTQVRRLVPTLMCSVVDNVQYYLIHDIKSRDSWRHIQTELAKLLAPSGIRCGYSLLFDDITQIKHYMDQAKNTLDISAKLYPNRHTIGFGSAQQAIMLSQIINNMDEISYTHKNIMLLRNYDEMYKTEYEKTLRVFLSCNCNTQKTTEILYIHRNTTQYRLKKIEEICDCSFEDPEVCKAMMLSSWAIDMKELLEKNDESQAAAGDDMTQA